MSWRCAWLVVLAACPPEPVAPRPTVDPSIATWLVAGHEMARRGPLGEDDALATYGREVVITASGYTTPWHGTCEDAKREHGPASLVEVTADVEVTPEGRARLKQFGLGTDPLEVRLTCQGRTTAPPLTIWITGNRAMTCFGGICFLLSH